MGKKKTVIVTGADGDIGFAITQSLSQNHFHVMALTHTNKNIFKFKELENITNEKIDNYCINLSEIDKIEPTVHEIFKEDLKVFGLINNAGVYPIKRIEEYDLKQWSEVININLTAPFFLIKSILPYFDIGGRIINISSTGAHLGSRDPAYSSSKAGLIGLTKSLARTLASRNILVNAIAPGVIDTKMSKRMKPEDRQKNLEIILLKRFGTTSDVKGMVNFLLSEESTYITGFTFDINGGLYIR